MTPYHKSVNIWFQTTQGSNLDDAEDESVTAKTSDIGDEQATQADDNDDLDQDDGTIVGDELDDEQQSVYTDDGDDFSVNSDGSKKV